MCEKRLEAFRGDGMGKILNHMALYKFFQSNGI